MNEKSEYTIGEVVELLRREYPDLTISSLRFLESRGLLAPHRTTGKHRLYSAGDISRIRLIKRLQAQRYYPLATIRHLLGKMERAKDPDAEMAFLETLYAPVTYDPHFVPLSREQLADRTGLSDADLARLEKIGFLFPESNGNGHRFYDEDDLKIAELVAQEVQLGAKLNDFVPYAAAMRALVQEEFNLFYRLAHGDEPGSERGRKLREEADLVHAVLRAKLTRRLLIQRKKG